MIVSAMFLFWNVAQMETKTGSINVNINVPVANHCDNGIQDSDETGVDCGGTCDSCGGGGTIYDNPTILFVSKDEYINSVKIIWEVNTFGHGLNTTTIFYSEGVDFASTTEVMVSGTQFVADILNLKSNTTYNFRITARDSNSVEVVPYQAQFKTSEANVLNSLIIKAKPQKRYPPVGVDFSVEESTLIFYDIDQDNNNALKNFVIVTTSLEKDGSTILRNIEVPRGINVRAVLKTNEHLAKKIIGVSTIGTDLTLDFTDNSTFELLAGDVIDSPSLENPTNSRLIKSLVDNGRNDVADSADINFTVNKYNNNIIEGIADFTKDGTIDMADVNTVWYNFDQKKVGDLKNALY